jgi:hypothetical protein
MYEDRESTEQEFGEWRSGRRPFRTTLFVWLSVLAVVGVMMVLLGALLAWLIVSTPMEH